MVLVMVLVMMTGLLSSRDDLETVHQTAGRVVQSEVSHVKSVQEER